MIITKIWQKTLKISLIKYNKQLMLNFNNFQERVL